MRPAKVAHLMDGGNPIRKDINHTIGSESWTHVGNGMTLSVDSDAPLLTA